MLIPYSKFIKGLISKIYKQIRKLNIKKMKKWAEELNRHLKKKKKRQTDGQQAHPKGMRREVLGTEREWEEWVSKWGCRASALAISLGFPGWQRLAFC